MITSKKCSFLPVCSKEFTINSYHVAQQPFSFLQNLTQDTFSPEQLPIEKLCFDIYAFSNYQLIVLLLLLLYYVTYLTLFNVVPDATGHISLRLV